MNGLRSKLVQSTAICIYLFIYFLLKQSMYINETKRNEVCLLNFSLVSDLIILNRINGMVHVLVHNEMK